MFTDRGIGSDSWVYVDSGCAVTVEVERTQVRFEFGHKAAALNFCVSKAMMPMFARLAQEALAELDERQRIANHLDEHVAG